MGTFEIKDSDYLEQNGRKNLLKTEKFNSFNESILGLGDIGIKPKKIDTISAIFDLEGFTFFCNQRDPELNVSIFLSEFLKWIFNEIKTAQIEEEISDAKKLYSGLPFLSKFVGDGVLFLWNAENMDDREICNSIVLMRNICLSFQDTFYPKISKKMVSPPSKLRCGIAKGTVFSIGNGNDFVGSCINVSARLQKMHNLSFCFFYNWNRL